uniref:angiogenin-like n=1 Tax=Euleptes europaea TaxID=460621 RepID=UPI00253FCA76|nr:angiogenin-like [Euleptes europaea]
MRPLEGACCFLLLMLVAEWLPGSSCADNPRYKKFLTQHRDDPKSNIKGPYCEGMMSKRGLTKPQCKQVNTFIHGSTKAIRAVCGKGGVPDGKLRRSKQHFKVTTCTLKGGSPRPPCKYKENTSPRYIVIACEGDWPVHYEEGRIVTVV